MLRSQLELFFQAPSASSRPASPARDYDEVDEIEGETAAESSTMPQKVGFDKQGRVGGVWVRKPRSSRKGSGGEHG